MNIRVLAALLAIGALLLASACSSASETGGSGDRSSSPTPAVTEPAATAPASTETPSVSPDAPVTNRPSPGTTPPPASTPVPPTVAANRTEVLAPIDGLGVAVLESFPPRYVLNVKAGLPSGCARQSRYDLSRSGTTITVRVWNTMPAGNPPCTAIYGTYDLRIDLGTDFQSGTQVTVDVNGRTLTFTAQ